MPALKNLKLKICGLRDNIDEVAAFKPDYAGFIFYPKSPRYVGADFSSDNLKNIPSSVAKVGVFVNQPLNQVEDLVEKLDLDFAQLHGEEDVTYCERLKAIGVGVIKVFAGNGELNKSELSAYEREIDYYLFDTRLQQYGGSGVTFDWNKLRDLDLQKPVFLSGGLDLDNIRQLEQIEGLDIDAIDINSRFEISPGLKNVELIRELVDNIRY